VTLPNNVPVYFDDNVEVEPEFRQQPDTQKLVGCLLEAAAAAATCNDEDNKDVYEDEDEDDDDKVHDITYFSASKWLEKNTPPVVIDLTLLRGSDFSDDDKKENEAPTPLTIKAKVEAATEETQWTALWFLSST
jgi:hypothetical protein